MTKSNVLTLSSRVDVGQVSRLLGANLSPGDGDNPEKYNGIRDRLKKMVSRYDKNGRFTVGYKHGRGVNFGRVYESDPGLQNLTGWMRRLMAGHLYQDIDIVNAAPSILLSEFRRLGVTNMPYLEELVQNREVVFETFDQSRSKKDQKQSILSVIHGANCGSDNPWLTNFSTEFNRSVDLVWDVPEISALRGKLGLRTNERGTLVAYMYQIVESTYVTELYHELSATGWTVGSLQFDGLLVELQDGRGLSIGELTTVTNRVNIKLGLQLH